MKVLFLHNYYQQSGGEDVVVTAELSLLQLYGHEVRLFALHNNIVQGIWRKIGIALQTHYSRNAYGKIQAEILTFKPDIVHVHNFFPQLTPSVYDACLDVNVPVVQTLHNYRTICPGALLLRNGRICEACIDKSPYLGALRGCYRGSHIGSLAVARMVTYHRRNRTWHEKVNRFIALTDFARSLFIRASFPPEKLIIKPNFVLDPSATPGTLSSTSHASNRTGALFVGRLSPEKGIGTLLKAWRSLDVPIRVIGDGPLLQEVWDRKLTKVICLGRRSPQEISSEMKGAAFLVMPSEWYETFGLVVIEAFSHGLPVIASRLGSLTELVEDGVTGLHFEVGNVEDLVAKVRWAAEHPDEMRRMGENARRVYEEKYTPEVNYRQLIDIYESLVAEK